MSGGGRRIRVAVLGGGLGAMAAAYELTKTAERRALYEVTVYQRGWRLGGKGASGRNAQASQRIEEHGLHAFLGFYDHAFALMRDVYDEWNKDSKYPFQSWTDAFKPQRQVTLEEELPDGRWSAWTIPMPRLPGEPGDGSALPAIAELLAAAIRWIDDRVTEGRSHGMALAPVRKLESAVESLLARVHADTVARGGWAAQLEHAALDAAHRLARWADAGGAGAEADARAMIDHLLGSTRDALRVTLALLRVDDADGVLRRLRTMIELGCAVAIGIVRDVLPSPRGFDAINNRDFRRWLESQGAPPDVAWSAPVRALYDLGFAYDGGVADVGNASAAAGVALRVLLYLAFAYKDAPLWKMQAGMGDAVFTPLYEVLAHQRGVRFEFFRRVQAVEPSANGNLVGRVVLSRQVNVIAPYDPLVEVKGLRCWPGAPRWEFIEGGAEMARHPDRYDFESSLCNVEVGRETLEYGRDFDCVVLGISVGALPEIAPGLAAASARWKRMLETTRTVATQAMQLWLAPDLAGLGWNAGTTIMTGYAEPFDSWGEMSHLLAREDWPATGAPKTIAYFCGALPDGDPATASDRVKQNAIEWLSREVEPLWPRATTPANPAGLDWGLLVDPAGGVGAARFDAQFWRANVDPSERYVLSVPGSIDARLAPDDSDFLNLVVAGDWTRSSLDGGSADAAIESGTIAGAAIVRLTSREPAK
jgi:uncharacterized protein with NAD-binding domain and iron-sulfur cluster